MTTTGIPRGPNDASTDIAWHIVESENMVKVFDANRGYVTQFDLRKFLGAECREKRMKKARLIADAPAAALILALICAGKASISPALPETENFAETEPVLLFADEAYEITGTYTNLVNAIGWDRACTALNNGETK